MAEGVSRDAGKMAAPGVGGVPPKSQGADQLGVDQLVQACGALRLTERTPYVAGQLDQGMHLRPRLEGIAVPPRFAVIRAPWTAGAVPVHVIAYVAHVPYASPVRRVLALLV